MKPDSSLKADHVEASTPCKNFPMAGRLSQSFKNATANPQAAPNRRAPIQALMVYSMDLGYLKGQLGGAGPADI